MALDLLIISEYVLVGLTLLYFSGNLDLSRKDGKIRSPNPFHKLKGKHPNGSVSYIEYYQKNPNGKLVWKFEGFEEPVPMEMVFDVIEEVGASGGQPSCFFIFRKNPDGSVQEWENPEFYNHFELKKQEKISLRESVASRKRRQEYKEESRKSLDRRVAEKMDSDFAEDQYGIEKKALNIVMNRQRGKGLGGGFSGEETIVGSEQSRD